LFPRLLIEETRLTEQEVEANVVQVLLHELAHWTQYLYLDSTEIRTLSSGKRNIRHDKRFIEKLAREWSGGQP